MNPNMLDFIMIIFVIACYFLSALRGAAKQIFSILAILVSFGVGGRVYENLIESFPSKVFPESFAGATSFALVFLGSFVVISLGGRLFEGTFKRLSLGAIDQMASRVLGVLKGMILSCMTVVIVMINYPSDTPLLTESRGIAYIVPAVNMVAQVLPPEKQTDLKNRETAVMGNIKVSGKDEAE